MFVMAATGDRSVAALLASRSATPGSGDKDPDQLPQVLIGNKTAAVTVVGSSPGDVNRLHVTVPDLTPDTYLLTAVRADGASATGPNGSKGISFRVLEKKQDG